MGNYKGFGDTKFIPNVDRAKFEALIRNSAAFEAEKSEMESLLNLAMDKIYSLNENERRLGFGNEVRLKLVYVWIFVKGTQNTTTTPAILQTTRTVASM
jgi:hypothetical protein